MSSKTNKVALVTGGSRGLGRDMAIQLAHKGFDVIITYNSRQSDADKTIEVIESLGKKAFALQLDVSNSHSFGNFSTSLSSLLNSKLNVERIDALVNNAGSGYHASFAESTEQGFDEMVNIHLKAPYFLTQTLLPYLNDGGSIVNISSGLTRFSFPGYSAYATMKGGVETLSSYLAKELGERKIRVNTVAPGAIETDFGNGAVRDNQELNDMISSLTVLGRVGLPDDLGSVVAFLCSDESKWVNAQRIEVSGGIFV